MKRIGETSGGTYIVELNKADWRVFARLVAEVAAAMPPEVDSISMASGGALQTIDDKQRELLSQEL